MFSLHSKLQLRLNEEAGLDNLAQSTCSAFRNTLTSEQDNFTSYCMGMSLLSILYLISKYEQKKQEKKIQVCNVAIFLF